VAALVNMRQARQTHSGVVDWNTLREVASAGYSDGILCLAAIETVERSNRASIIGPLNDLEAGLAAKLLTDSAFVRVHLYVVRAFAPVSRADDLHLRAAVNFLRDHLCEESDQQRREHLAHVVQLFDQAEADPRLASLKHMRDKQLAHWANPTPGVPLPLYNELFEFTRRTCEIWERLSFGAGTVMITLETQVEAYRESADAFWSRWEK